MEVDLTPEQRDCLELIAIQAGKSAGQLLLESAQFLLDLEAGVIPQVHATRAQQFLSEEDMQARLVTLLRS